MKLTALFIALAMVCMALEGCDTRTAYDSRVVMAEIESGLMRANQAFIEGFADRPAQIITIDYKRPASKNAAPIEAEPTS